VSGYNELRDLGIVFRPFDGAKPTGSGQWSRFDAAWSDTCALLARELRHLDAKQIVVEIDIQERDLRLDGLPRADARLASDAVRISFESKWGPQRIETAEFAGRWSQPGWQSNLRAIALGLEALRKVDRYGIAKRGEQYTGWRQIAQTSGGFQSREQAQAWLEEHGGYKAAARKLHPDNLETGDEDEFKKLQQARALVGA
jgi:hypothetical protein